MPTLAEIEAAAKALSEAREALAALATEMNAAIDEITRHHRPQLKRLVAKQAERVAALHALIEPAPELFVRPRTVVFHGIKLGFEKGKGSVTFGNESRVVALIRKPLPEQFDALVKVEEKPRKTAIAALSVAECKLIGATVTDAGDQVVIRPMDSAVDKMVDALLKAAVDDAQDQREVA